MASKVAFITNSGGRFGLGHLSRCGSIAKQLLANGHEVQIFLGQESEPTEHEKSLGSIVHRLGKELFTTDHKGNQIIQSDLVQELETERPDALFLDSYQIDTSLHSNISKWCHKTIVIDDLASNRFTCSHLINYSPTVSETDYSGRITDSTELHLGLKFFPVPETLKSQKARTDRQNYLAVCLGGSDTAGITETLVRELKRCDIIEEFEEIVVINGLTSQKQSELDLGPKFRVLAQPRDYTKLIGDARVAITGAGVSALERLYMETPGIIMTAADNQRANFNYLTDSEIFIGYEPDRHGAAELNQLIKRGLTHSVRNTIIDGYGANRIAAIVETEQVQGS